MLLVFWCKGFRGLRARGPSGKEAVRETGHGTVEGPREAWQQTGCRSWMGRLISGPRERSEQLGQEGSGLGLEGKRAGLEDESRGCP